MCCLKVNLTPTQQALGEAVETALKKGFVVIIEGLEPIKNPKPFKDDAPKRVIRVIQRVTTIVVVNEEKVPVDRYVTYQVKSQCSFTGSYRDAFPWDCVSTIVAGFIEGSISIKTISSESFDHQLPSMVYLFEEAESKTPEEFCKVAVLVA